MEIEEISKVEIRDNGEMFVALFTGGKPMYQYICREAAVVYWDNGKKAFKAPPPRKWSHSDWFHHIVGVAASGLGISLELSSNTNWVNLSPQTKLEICTKPNT